MNTRHFSISIITAILMAVLLPAVQAATVTGRSAKTSLAGTEELPINDSGTDKKVTVANLLLTPQGAMTATTFNGLTIDTTTGTFDLTSGKTLAVTNSLTLSGTDSTTMTFPGTSQTLVGLTATQTLTNKTLTSPTITPTDPTADRTITVPNASGTVTLAQSSTTTALTADDQAVTPGSNTRLQLTSDNATAANRTFTLSATGAITGQIYVIIAPATNACELADTGIQKLSAAWSPGAYDTLTLLFDGTNFLEIGRADN